MYDWQIRGVVLLWMFNAEMCGPATSRKMQAVNGGMSQVESAADMLQKSTLFGDGTFSVILWMLDYMYRLFFFPSRLIRSIIY